MKKKEVKQFVYGIRVEIINEIGELKRMEENTQKTYVKDNGSFVYGYRRGLTEAAMIMLDRIYDKFPEENKEE